MQDLDELKYIFEFALTLSKEKTLKSRFYNENNFKPCLTKQLLNMFKLWCEWGIGSAASKLICS